MNIFFMKSLYKTKDYQKLKFYQINKQTNFNFVIIKNIQMSLIKLMLTYIK